jgi:hypothetical protein
LDRERGRQSPPPNFNQAEIDAAMRNPRRGPDEGVGLLGSERAPPPPPLHPLLDPGETQLTPSPVDRQPDWQRRLVGPPPSVFRSDEADNWGYRTDALGPQTPTELERYERAGDQVGATAAAIGAAAPIVAAGPMLNMAARTAGALGRAAMANPRLTGTALVGTAGLGGVPGPTRSDPPGPERLLATARENEATARSNLADAQGRVAALQTKLDEFNNQFGRVTASSPRAQITRLQEFLAAQNLYTRNIDGRWGNPGESNTQSAIDAYRKSITDAQKRIRDTDVVAANQAISEAVGRVRTLEGNANYAAAERDMSPLDRFLRDNQMAVALGLGAAIGPAARMVRTSTANSGGPLGTGRLLEWLGLGRGGFRGEERRLNALIDPSGDVNRRVSGTTNFFERGTPPGRQINRPFIVDPGSPHGFRASGNQTLGENLFPPRQGSRLLGYGPRTNPTIWDGGMDTAALGAAGANAARVELMTLPAAREELAAAREAYDKDKSRRNADRLVRAEAAYASAMINRNASLAAIPGYTTASFFNRYRFPQPDVRRAGEEVMNLNAILRTRPPAVERWSSPRGRETLERYQPNGPYFNRRGEVDDLTPHRRRTWTQE